MEPTINLWNLGLGYCAYSTKGEYRGVRDFPGGPVVETLFLMQRVLVPSLVGEVRSHMPGNVAGKEKKKKKSISRRLCTVWRKLCEGWVSATVKWRSLPFMKSYFCRNHLYFQSFESPVLLRMKGSSHVTSKVWHLAKHWWQIFEKWMNQ